MSDIEQRAERLKKIVDVCFDRWRTDPAAFASDNPDIVVALERSERTETGVLRAIADHVMRGTGFEYQIADRLGAGPLFFICRYDERDVKR